MVRLDRPSSIPEASIIHDNRGVLDRPIKSGDDTEHVARNCINAIIGVEASSSFRTLNMSNIEHASAFSRHVLPELCFISPPSLRPRGRREGRVPAGTRGPLCAKAVDNCTAAYR
jgi:hypothetical protein